MSVSTLAFLSYGLLSFTLYRQRIGNWDSAIFVQVADAYSKLSIPIVNIENPGANQWGEHFSPILVALAPIYRVFPSVLTIQLCQDFLVALAVFLLARTALRHLSTRTALVVSVGFAFSFGFQSAVVAGFHEVCFAAPMLVVIGDRYLAGRYHAAALWSLPLLLVKEDLGLVVGALGICLFIRGARTLGAALSVGATVYLVAIVFWVIPTFNASHHYEFLNVASGGAGSPWHLLATLPSHLFAPGVKPVTVLISLAVAGFVGLRSPFLILLIPIFAERFAAPVPYYWGLNYHYSLPVMPIVFVAAIEGLARLDLSAAHRARLRTLVSQTVIMGMCLASATIFGLQGLVSAGLWQKTDRAVAANELMARIPAGASVQTDVALSSFLAVDHVAYFLPPPHPTLPHESEIGADFIVVDQTAWDDLELDGVRYARESNPGVDYVVTYTSHGLSLLQRTSP